MKDVVPVRGELLGRVLDAAYASCHDGLDPQAYARFHAALTKTPWGQRCQRGFALVDDGELLASAEQYDLAGTFGGREVRICGVGPVVTSPAHRGLGYARTLIETLLDRAAQRGAEVAILYPRADLEDQARQGFEMIPLIEVTIHVAESARHGAPMTMVRGGEERDLAAIVAMGRVRAGGLRFHLDRDIDLVRHAITRKRLLAGLGPPGARQLQFFIAEEGTTAAAYVVVSVEGSSWTLEECGDRDTAGARVGALLQALIAREPAERRPTIRGWLPPAFLPPQVSIVSAVPSTEIMMVRAIALKAGQSPLSGDEVLLWRSDFL